MQQDRIEKLLQDLQYELKSVAISIAEITTNQKRDERDYREIKELMKELRDNDSELDERIKSLEKMKLLAHGGWLVFCVLCSAVFSAVSLLTRIL